MKRKVLVIVIVIVLLMLSAGCGTSENSDIGKAYAEIYYSSFSSNDYSTCISMFHESLIDNVGGSDAILSMYQQMNQAYGDLTDFKVKQTGFYSSGGETDVDLSIDVTYANGLSATDAMTVWVLKDGTAYITAISTGQPE